MKGEQILFLATTFVAIAGCAVAAQFRWLRDGPVKMTVLFLAGVVAVLSLRFADLPPAWFAGKPRGFLLALMFLLWAWTTHAGEERSFGLPLLLGMGLTLFAANALRLVFR